MKSTYLTMMEAAADQISTVSEMFGSDPLDWIISLDAHLGWTVANHEDDSNSLSICDEAAHVIVGKIKARKIADVIESHAELDPEILLRQEEDILAEVTDLDFHISMLESQLDGLHQQMDSDEIGRVMLELENLKEHKARVEAPLN